MEEEDPSTAPDTSLDSSGPGEAYALTLQSQILMDRLKCLAYEKGYLKAEKGRPIEKQSFVSSRGTGESFFSFVSLSSWLIRQSGNPSFPIPSQVDDPNTTISSITTYLRSKERGGEWSLARLRSGYGEEVVEVMNRLAVLAMEHQGFVFRKPIIRHEEDEESEGEGGDESSGNESDDGELAMDEDEDGLMVDLSLPKTRTDAIEGVLKSDMKTSQNWKEEVDRVAPLLKILIPDGKDWRVHMDKMVTMKGKMEQLKGVVEGKMNEMGDTMEKSMRIIESREKSLALQMESSIGRLKEKKDDLAEKNETYKSRSGGIVIRNKTLESVSQDIRQIKEHIEAEETKSTDGAPLVKVRQSLLRLQEESVKMGVQCAVAEQSLLHSNLSERLTLSKNAYGLL